MTCCLATIELRVTSVVILYITVAKIDNYFAPSTMRPTVRYVC